MSSPNEKGVGRRRVVIRGLDVAVVVISANLMQKESFEVAGRAESRSDALMKIRRLTPNDLHLMKTSE